MNKRNIGYWILTAITAGFTCLVGGAFDLSRSEPVVQTMNHLGFPVWFAAFIGVWKVLGGIALLAPRAPRFKEWAYAGIAFDLIGAVVAHAMVGDPANAIITPIVLLAIAAGSWWLRPASRKLGGDAPAETPPARAAAASA